MSRQDDLEWRGGLRREREPAAAEAEPAELIVCTTCDEPAGERLLAQLKQALDARPGPEPALALRSIQCLWACERSCAVHLRRAGRMGYVLGGFAQDRDGVALLLAFVERYLASDDGVVLVGEWPPGLRPHFVCRVPPAAVK